MSEHSEVAPAEEVSQYLPAESTQHFTSHPEADQFADLMLPIQAVQQVASHIADDMESSAWPHSWLDLYARMSASPPPDRCSSDSMPVPARNGSGSPAVLWTAHSTTISRVPSELHQVKGTTHDSSPTETHDMEEAPQNYPQQLLAWSFQACLRYNEGLYDEADGLMRKASGVFGKMIRLRHGKCLTSLNILTVFLDVHGKREVASLLLDKFKATILIMKDIPEKESILLTIRFKNDIMCGLKPGKMSHPADLQRVYSDFKEHWGANSPSTLACLCNLGWRLAGEDEDPSKLEEAHDVLCRAREIGERFMGPNDLQTIVCLTILARVLDNLNRRIEALETMRAAMNRIENRFPEYHPYRLAALRRFCLLVEQAGGESAEPVLREVAAKRFCVLGPSSKVVRQSIRELERILKSQGREFEAAGIDQAILEAASRLDSGLNKVELF